jgi:hypothetical protein
MGTLLINIVFHYVTSLFRVHHHVILLINQDESR